MCYKRYGVQFSSNRHALFTALLKILIIIKYLRAKQTARYPPLPPRVPRRVPQLMSLYTFVVYTYVYIDFLRMFRAASCLFRAKRTRQVHARVRQLTVGTSLCDFPNRQYIIIVHGCVRTYIICIVLTHYPQSFFFFLNDRQFWRYYATGGGGGGGGGGTIAASTLCFAREH